jgi:uncharacterized protein YjiS (DUF1127 family)
MAPCTPLSQAMQRELRAMRRSIDGLAMSRHGRAGPVFSAGSLSAHAAAAGRVLVVWFRRASSRRRLASLPEAALKDIGISRYDALAESRKPFWRA